ncbi:MAG: sugar MFS transporter [Cellvibrionaceae bacterium]|nr:sugar MFS transporter [Cellvibrionaceae bacterium]
MTTQAIPQPKTLIPMMIIGTLFFVFGFVTWLNGSLIPFLKIICDLNEFQALFVTLAFYIAYTVMALPSAIILKAIGYKTGMVLGLGIMAAGALIFIPAAQWQHYGVFLLALFTLGSGLTLLQTASNPYIVLIGPSESAAKRISIMGLINKGAGVIVPLVFTALILSGIQGYDEASLAALSELERESRIAELSQRLVLPYIYMAVVLVGLAVFVQFSALEDLNFEADDKQSNESPLAVLQFPHLILGALTLFCYVGVEVIAGDTIGLYGQQLGVDNFASLTSYTMVFMVIGYLFGVAFIPRFISQATALSITAVAGLAFTLGAVYSSAQSTALADILFSWAGVPAVPDTIVFVALLGLANALVWPTVWPLALKGLGKFTATGSALLIMGIAGGAILPLAYGHFAVDGNAQNAYLVNLPCYLIILFYGLKGHKIRANKK